MEITDKQNLPKGIYEIVEQMVILGNVLPRSEVNIHSIKLALRNYQSAKERAAEINLERFDKIVESQLKFYGYDLKSLEVTL